MSLCCEEWNLSCLQKPTGTRGAQHFARLDSCYQHTALHMQAQVIKLCITLKSPYVYSGKSGWKVQRCMAASRGQNNKAPLFFWLQVISVVRVIPGHLIAHGLCAAPLLQGGFGSLCLPAREECGAANRMSGDKLLQTSA